MQFSNFLIHIIKVEFCRKVVLRLSWSRGCFKPITAWMDTLRYRTRIEEDHSGVLFGPRRNSPGMDTGWELPPRMRSRTSTDLLAHYPVLGCLPGKLQWRNLTTFTWMSPGCHVST